MIKSLTAALFTVGLFASSAAFAGEKTVTLAVPDMYCATCPITVKSSLEAVLALPRSLSPWARRQRS